MSNNQSATYTTTKIKSTSQLKLDKILFFLIALLVVFVSIAIGLYFYSPDEKTLSNWIFGRPRTDDKRIRISTDIRNVYLGEKVQTTLEKQVICSVCKGTGADPPDAVHTCPKCKGRGYINVVQHLGHIQFQTQQMCNMCNGRGKHIEHTCPKCGGHGVYKIQDEITVSIQNGIPEGGEIKIPYGADESPGYTPGDLYFYIYTNGKSPFKRDQNDLHYDITITLLDALVGFKRVISHLDDSKIEIERNEITIPGQVIVLNGKGMPHYMKSGKYGNLYVHVTVKFPTSLNDNEKEVVRKLLPP